MSHISLSVSISRILCLVVFLASFSALAQRQKTPPSPRTGSTILDDSTRNIYGPKTTLWTTEKDLFENRPNYRPLDTAINNYHRWTYVERFNNLYKDLGPMGTALSSIFPQAPSIAGATSGFEAFDPYYSTEEPKYFNTKSPFTRMYIIWGGNGRAMTRVEFSRNINPRWNFGMNYRPILVEKQIQRRQKGDYQTVSHYYDFYTTYKSKNDKYFLLFNYRRIRHRVTENGGVYNPTNDFLGFFDGNARPILVGAESEMYKRNIHLSQSYQLAKAFQIYHIVDFTHQTNGFKDDGTVDAKTLFDNVVIDSLKTQDNTTFDTNQQEFGIKGNARKLFYSAYYKVRNYSWSNWYFPFITTGTENYVGGTMSLRLDSLSEISGSAEYLLQGYYRVEGKIVTPWIEGSFKNVLSKPGFMQMYYKGSHDLWDNPFDKINSTEAKGYLKFNKGPLQLWVGATFALIKNYVYFRQITPDTTRSRQTVLPFQTSDIQSTLSPEIKANIRFLNHFYFKPQFIYTTFLDNLDTLRRVLRIPKVFVNTQITYENNLFKNHLQMQAGLDIHWQSAYKALGYDPSIQTFYVQDKVTVNAFPLVDVFFTGKMRRARFFFKYHNLIQAFPPATGFLPTPGYPGQRSLIDFGFDFLLFD